ncbi:MAG: RNA pyrophosphohydrolase [Pseudomonadales bacterium]|nr:RNA pyrophosphohydrolase [Pseudomonadales bacterium]
MIDSDGFRPNVGIILVNQKGQLLWARRVGGHDAWQFPQGGIQRKETPEDALFRELGEEIGLDEKDVRILGCTRGWLRYRLPTRFIRMEQNPVCYGQKQKWFILEMLSDDSKVHFDNCDDEPPEFDQWRWVSYWYPINQVVSFKREVYRRALKELLPHQIDLVKKTAQVL